MKYTYVTSIIFVILQRTEFPLLHSLCFPSSIYPKRTEAFSMRYIGRRGMVTTHIRLISKLTIDYPVNAQFSGSYENTSVYV
jgi:hypothetical protein